MPTLFAFLLLLAADQSPVSATFISKEDHEAVLKKQVADNVVDQPIKASDVPGGKASVAMLHRVKPGDIIIVPAARRTVSASWTGRSAIWFTASSPHRRSST